MKAITNIKFKIAVKLLSEACKERDKFTMDCEECPFWEVCQDCLDTPDWWYSHCYEDKDA